MFNLNEELAIYKFDLIKLCLNSKGKSSSFWKELREKLVILNYLITKNKTDKNFECSDEVIKIKEFISKTK